MSRKKLDSRILKLIKRSIHLRHRCMFFICGPNSRNQVMFLHHLLLKCKGMSQEKILWCYKKEAQLNIRHSKKKLKQLRKKGEQICSDEDAFESFLLTTIPYFCHYSETDRVLGQTFDILVVQDFEGVTPNILARITECVGGGGAIIFLIKEPLNELQNINMDAHARFVTESHDRVSPLFNRRLLFSLSTCPSCIATDDNLSIKLLPTATEESQSIPNNSPFSTDDLDGPDSVCKTSDQLQALHMSVLCLDSPSIAWLSSGRGRGKSAVLGLAISVALHKGLRVVITAPHPSNVQILMQFVGEGLKSYGWMEKQDYTLVRDSSTSFLITVVVHHDGRRGTATYLQPLEHHGVVGADVVVVDEAAAIPLPLVKRWVEGSPQTATLLMASTIHGYEGTGRSLSLKLLEQLRSPGAGRPLTEIQLSEAIRYADGDPIESWLHRLLCLEPTIDPLNSLPDLHQCQLYHVNKRVLFSSSRAADRFLHRLVSLFVFSHYKNSPNDLQMAADAPAHHLFCLMSKKVEQPLVVIQVALEGGISCKGNNFEQSHGRRAQGDLIPWIISQQFQDKEFPSLTSARIVRIATHPDCQRMGFGKHALELLSSFYSSSPSSEEDDEDVLLQNECSDRKILDYLGVSFGLTHDLLRFWKKAGFVPLYIRQTTSDVTGEHSCVLVRPLRLPSPWIEEFASDFCIRFNSLLPTSFRDISSALAADLLHHKCTFANPLPLSQRSLLRLDAYCRNEVDFHLISDLLPTLFKMAASLPTIQQRILLCLGVQGKSVEESAKEMNMEPQQLLGCFRKAVRKIRNQTLLDFGNGRCLILRESFSYPKKDFMYSHALIKG